MKRQMSALLCMILSLMLVAKTAEAATVSDKSLRLTLEEAVRIALTQNSEIKMAESSVAAAREAARSKSADLLPKFETRYSAVRLNDDPEVIFGKGLEFIAGSKPNYRWTVGFTQPVFTGFALTTAKELAALGVDTARLNKEEAEEEIILRTRAAYFQHLLAERLKGVAEEAVRRLRAHLKDAQALYDAGMIPQNDLLKSKVRMAEAEQEEVRAGNRVELTRSQLNLLLRREINAKTQLTDVLTWTPYNLTLKDSLARGLAKRPAIQATQLAVEKADKGVRLAESRYYPNLVMVGEYERQGDTAAVNGNGYTNTKNASIGLEARWTFFEWGKTGAEVSRSRYEKERAVEAGRRLRDRIALQIKQAWLDLQTAGKNIETAKTELEQAKENYRITDLQYKEQMTTSTEVLDAESLLTQAETHNYGALYGYNLARASLERAMGTGRP
ncbi:MAG: TolC family protein [Deltaproteobacteria bacterium]|nr:TolC family protein [Deltaproteobacteria bacterium]